MNFTLTTTRLKPDTIVFGMGRTDAPYVPLGDGKRSEYSFRDFLADHKIKPLNP